MDTPHDPEVAKREELIAKLARTAMPVPDPPPPPSVSWVRQLLACNPFYLVSAALLLYGFYLVSGDANFPGKETAQFAFNFTALQGYEILLVATAILLARRHLWYDSTLLVGLENLLVLVPFVLISQAAWIDQQTLWITCLVAGGMAVLRFGSLKLRFAELNLPGRLLAPGFVLLAVNVALPILYHHFNLLKVGTKPTDGSAYELNRWTWLAILPALIALANLLPRPAQSGELLPQRRWLPTSLFTLWLTASTVHLCFLGYVYNFDWEFLFLAPPLWALAWTCQRRHNDFLPAPVLDRVLMIPPVLAALLPLAADNELTFQILTALNIACYAGFFLQNRRNWMALHLLILSAAALGASLMERLPTEVPTDVSAGRWLVAFLAVYACYWIWRSRNPKLGVLGALIVGAVAGAVLDRYPGGSALAVQSGLLFFLLHSLVWDETKDFSARTARILGCCLWLAHSLFLVLAASPHAGLVLGGTGAFVLAVCCVIRLVRGRWLQPGLPVAAASVLLLQPGAYAAVKLQSVPTGLWVVAGSFLLFACGTLAALTRPKWHPQPAPTLAATHNPPTNPTL